MGEVRRKIRELLGREEGEEQGEGRRGAGGEKRMIR